MKKKGLIQILILLLFPLFLPACGIETYYYISQVSEGNIERRFNTEATVRLDPLSEEYASGYRIYYRIYISDLSTDADITESEQRREINSTLYYDYSAFYSFTDPTNYSSLPSTNTFSNRNYHELELEGKNLNNLLSRDSLKSRITFKLSFEQRPGLHPSFIVSPGTSNEEQYFLFRNNSNGDYDLEPDRYFFFSFDLDNETNHTFDVNNDVAKHGTGGTGFAYVSMYVVAIGANSMDFSTIYSKPTHIGIFKLPDAN